MVNDVFSSAATNLGTRGGTGEWPARSYRRRMAGTKSQRKTPALGAPQPAEPQTTSHHRGGIGHTANPCPAARPAAGGNAAASSAPRIKHQKMRDVPAGTGKKEVAGQARSAVWKVAAGSRRRHTSNMASPAMPGSRCNGTSGKIIRAAILCALATCAMAVPAPADEIRLKDGRKLYGVIVAYEDNMFKIKTDFGYELIEKDKIAAILPTTPAAATAKKETPADPAKAEPVPASVKTDMEPKAEPAVDSSKAAPPVQFNAN